MSTTAVDDDARFQRLLAWLANHGMDIAHLPIARHAVAGAGHGLFATIDLPAGQPVFKIPATALMNVRTLPKIKSLTPVQRVTMHLAAHRPRKAGGSRNGSSGTAQSDDPKFGPFIDSLPTEFDGHPLTWRVNPSRGAAQHRLDKHLPPSVNAALDSLEERFTSDRAAIYKYMKNDPRERIAPWFGNASPDAFVMDILWGWLNVNTRCLYHRLARTVSDPANFTMGPLVDFANHAGQGANLVPRRTQADIFDCAPMGLGEPLVLGTAVSGPPTPAGTELRLQYGAHAQRTLFVEYGFVDRVGGMPAEADVQDLVEGTFVAAVDPARAVWVRHVLEDEGYWGDWTIHKHEDEPAYPSFRLVAALRLGAMALLREGRESALPAPGLDECDALLAPWRATLLGRATQISEENERAWREMLLDLCERMRVRGEEVLVRLDGVVVREEHEWMRETVRALWREEVEVASAIRESVERGVEF